MDRVFISYAQCRALSADAVLDRFTDLFIEFFFYRIGDFLIGFLHAFVNEILPYVSLFAGADILEKFRRSAVRKLEGTILKIKLCPS